MNGEDELGNLDAIINFKISDILPDLEAGGVSDSTSVDLKDVLIQESDGRTQVPLGIGGRLEYTSPEILKETPKKLCGKSRQKHKHSPADKGAGRPPYSYTEIIEYALLDMGSSTVKQIYNWIKNHFDYYKKLPNHKWQPSVRHTLTMSHRFEKVDKGKGCFIWGLAPDQEPAKVIRKKKNHWKKQKLAQYESSSVKKGTSSPSAPIQIEFPWRRRGKVKASYSKVTKVRSLRHKWHLPEKRLRPIQPRLSTIETPAWKEETVSSPCNFAAELSSIFLGNPTKAVDTECKVLHREDSVSNVVALNFGKIADNVHHQQKENMSRQQRATLLADNTTQEAHGDAYQTIYAQSLSLSALGTGHDPMLFKPEKPLVQSSITTEDTAAGMPNNTVGNPQINSVNVPTYVVAHPGLNKKDESNPTRIVQETSPGNSIEQEHMSPLKAVLIDMLEKSKREKKKGTDRWGSPVTDQPNKETISASNRHKGPLFQEVISGEAGNKSKVVQSMLLCPPGSKTSQIVRLIFPSQQTTDASYPRTSSLAQQTPIDVAQIKKEPPESPVRGTGLVNEQQATSSAKQHSTNKQNPSRISPKQQIFASVSEGNSVSSETDRQMPKASPRGRKPKMRLRLPVSPMPLHLPVSLVELQQSPILHGGSSLFTNQHLVACQVSQAGTPGNLIQSICTSTRHQCFGESVPLPFVEKQQPTAGPSSMSTTTPQPVLELSRNQSKDIVSQRNQSTKKTHSGPARKQTPKGKKNQCIFDFNVPLNTSSGNQAFSIHGCFNNCGSQCQTCYCPVCPSTIVHNPPYSELSFPQSPQLPRSMDTPPFDVSAPLQRPKGFMMPYTYCSSTEFSCGYECRTPKFEGNFVDSFPSPVPFNHTIASASLPSVSPTALVAGIAEPMDCGVAVPSNNSGCQGIAISATNVAHPNSVKGEHGSGDLSDILEELESAPTNALETVWEKSCEVMSQTGDQGADMIKSPSNGGDQVKASDFVKKTTN